MTEKVHGPCYRCLEKNMMIHSHTVHTQVNDVLADPVAHAWEVIQKTVHLWLEIKWCKNNSWRWSVFRWANKLLRKLSKILSPNLHRQKQRRWRNPIRRFALPRLYALQPQRTIARSPYDCFIRSTNYPQTLALSKKFRIKFEEVHLMQQLSWMSLCVVYPCFHFLRIDRIMLSSIE